MPTTDDADRTDLHCPDCGALLKSRRSRTPDRCEMLCGGCGQRFDVCDLDTLNKLQPKG